jgi:sugar phosphate permease
MLDLAVRRSRNPKEGYVHVSKQYVAGALVLLQDKGVQNAAVQVSGLELGGLLGSLSSGAISDYLVRSNDGSRGNVGLRVQARAPLFFLFVSAPCPSALLEKFACIYESGVCAAR